LENCVVLKKRETIYLGKRWLLVILL
jgi:hypothetical protein